MLSEKFALETQQKAAKLEKTAALVAADEASRSKSAVLSTVSHELRTPLNGIIGMVSLLTETPLTSEQREYLEIIRLSGNNLLDVINDILDFSKLEAGKLVVGAEPFSITNCLEDIGELFVPAALQSNNRFFLHIDPSVPESIVGDEARIRQILVNLVGNALKFTDNGEVSIKVHSSHRADTLHLDFQIVDTGVGIEKKLLKRIFSAFTQYENDHKNLVGTGLGLAISKRLSLLMNGTLTVDSERGVGTTFTFSLPVKRAKSSVEEYYNTNKQLLSDTVIAVVSDSEGYVESVVSTLDRWNVQHVSYTTFGSWHSIGEGISCVLVDWPAFDKRGGSVVNDLRNMYGFAELPIVLQCPVNRVTSVLREYNDLCNMILTTPTRRLQMFDSLLAAHADNDCFVNTETRKFIPRELGNTFPLNILVVDGTDLIRRQLTTMLRMLNYESYETHLGMTAIELSEHQKYDLILMDLHLPGGTGIETAQTILNRASTSNVFIVAMTNAPNDKERQLCEKVGFKHYTKKPQTLSELHSIIEVVRETFIP